MRKDSGLAEQKRLDLAKRSRIRRIEELKSKIENRDFSKREQKPLPVDAELLEIESKLQEQKAIYEKEKYIDELNNRTRFRKILSSVLNILGLPRIFKATGEFSSVLVQLGFLTGEMIVRNPTKLRTAFLRMMNAFIDSDKAQQFESEMKANPLYPLMQKTKLTLTGVDHKLDAQEELFESDIANDFWNLFSEWVDKKTDSKEFLTIKGLIKKFLGKNLSEKDRKTLGNQIKNSNPFKMFERASVSFSNYMKIAKFEEGVRMLQEDLKDPINDIEDYKKVAKYINTFSGRPNLGKIEQVSKEASNVFFSLRMAYSQILQLSPVFYSNLGDIKQWKNVKSVKDLKNIKPTVAQKMAVKSFMTSTAAVVGFMTAFVAIANESLGDDEEKWRIETDPRSTDFGKMIRGEKKFDMWHGLNGLFVLYWRILVAREIKDKKGVVKKLGEGFNGKNANDLLIQYVTNKFSPTFSTLWQFNNSTEQIDPNTGEVFRVNDFGEIYDQDYFIGLFTPIYYGAVSEIAKDDPDAYEAFLTSLGILGFSIQGKDSSKNWYDIKKGSGKVEFPDPSKNLPNPMKGLPNY